MPSPDPPYGDPGVKVTRTSNGASATCKVDDRGPTPETGRLIDLSLDTFEKLGDRGTGLIECEHPLVGRRTLPTPLRSREAGRPAGNSA